VSEEPWYRTFFGEHYLRLYTPALTPERTAREVEGVLRLLGLPPGSRILDLCCGHGRHAVPLAAQGYEVTGQDLSELFLARARDEAEAEGVRVHWVQGDMREIPFQEEFDAVLNLFTAFGYLESDEEDQKVLRQVHQALQPGGLFLMELINRDGLMRRYRPHEITRFEDGLIQLDEGEFDLLGGRNHVRVTLIYPDGRRDEYRHDERIYTASELARMLMEAGLELKAAYGGLDGSPLTLESRRLVLVSRKPAAS
jgi:SAM-dependent methyltransferase